MEGMDHGHMDGMDTPALPQTHSMMKMKMKMHMTFFWGKNAEILFPSWPGTSTGMYVLALVFVFFLALFAEFLSSSRLMKPGSRNVAAGLVQTLLQAIRMGLLYLVMLAVMSFNVGVFLVAVGGHALGFLVFGSRAFKNTVAAVEKPADHPPLSWSC